MVSIIKEEQSEGRSEMELRQRLAAWLSALEDAGFAGHQLGKDLNHRERELEDGVVLVATLTPDYRICTIEVRSRYADNHERTLCEFNYNRPGDIGPSVKIP